MASPEAVLLKSTLEIQNKAYTVKLTSSEIYWEDASSARAAGGPYSEPLVMNGGSEVVSAQNEPRCCGGRRSVHPATRPPPPHDSIVDAGEETESQTVKLSEVIAVRLGLGDTSHEDPGTSAGGSRFQNLEMVSLNPTAFTLWVVKRCRKHRWRERKVTFLSKDTSVIQQWVDILHEALSKPEFCRPRNLLVFVNPVGGKGHATRIYSKRVAPIFELAGVSTEVVTTNHQNHARDTLRDYDLAKFDGIVSIGGDGMFTEIVHGLMARTLADSDVEQLTPETVLPQPTIRIGIIPAGSTDTVAWTTCGTKDATTAAIHIVIGDDTAIDLGICFSGNRFIKYNVSMMAYGYYGDCIVDSEANRWMGPKRYDWEGFKKLLANKSYEGELTYLPCPDKENHPRDGTHCKAGCSVCSAAPVAEAEPDNNPSQSLQDKGWQKVKGRFIGINAFVMSCRCRFAPEGPAPCAHLGDGCIDLIVIHECSRVDYMRHLFRCMDPKKDQFDFPFIQAIRCRDFKFRPITDDLEDAHDSGVEGQQRLRSRTSCLSVWNCDGEVVEEPSIDYRIHRKMIRLFARGVEDEISETSNGCLNCAGRN